MNGLKNLSEEILSDAALELVERIKQDLITSLNKKLGRNWTRSVTDPWNNCDVGKTNYRSLIGEWIVTIDGLMQILTFSEYELGEWRDGSLKFKLEVL